MLGAAELDRLLQRARDDVASRRFSASQLWEGGGEHVERAAAASVEEAD